VRWAEISASIGICVQIEVPNIEIDFLNIGEADHVLPQVFLVLVIVFSLETLREVGIVSELEDLVSRDERAIVVDESDIVALDVPPRPGY
jgi:hypothetical protein